MTGFSTACYQGRLNSSTNVANGSYDLTFTLFGVSSGGSPIIGPVTNLAVLVTNGLFSTTLNMSNNFPGADRWLELGVRSNLSGTFVTLSPRQEITAVPYAITASNVTGVVASGSLSGTYSGAVSLNNAANSFTGGGAGLTGLNAASLTSGQVPSSVLGNAWKITGNAATTPGANFLGTADNQALEMRVNGLRALRLEPVTDPTNLSVNVIGGSAANFVNSYGATIGGGGGRNFGGPVYTNSVTGPFGTVSGGGGNSVAAFGGSIAGGFENSVTGSYATTGGGLSNSAAGLYATVPGGYANTAAGAQSFAAGTRSQANHDGAFVWADDTVGNFTSTGVNQFLIRAAGGVGIGTASPQTQLHVRSSNGSQLRLESSTVNAYWNIYTEDNRPTSYGNLLFLSSSGVFIYFDTSGFVHDASDQRLKRDITPIGPSLDRLLQLRPVSYRMRGQPDDATRTLGFLAQEVEPLFPQVVGESGGMKSLAYSELIPVTVSAIQELNGKVLAKDAEIRELKQQNQSLTERLDKLESMVRSLAEKQ